MELQNSAFQGVGKVNFSYSSIDQGNNRNSISISRHQIEHITHTLQQHIVNTFSTRSGADPGGGSWGSGPPPFGGPPNCIKKEKMARACARKLRILVLNSYPDPPPFRNPVSAPAA